jgi:Flp pilus assembly protein TadD
MLATKKKDADEILKIDNGIARQRPICQLTSSILNLPVFLVLALAVFISGCRPAGPRALLDGKASLDDGDYTSAVAELKTATSLMVTNAQAWNYYGVALQHAGQPTDAAQAYGNALKFDHDLTEAHYNLGCLWLEQNKLDSARTEFTAYTLRRKNAPEGWVKLGTAQLRAGDLSAAEVSFSTALSLSTNNAEALNGMGLARAKNNKPQDAQRFFAWAVKAHPDYAPALLNLATVEQQYLHDSPSALQHYRAYLELSPRPANYEAVNALAKNLEQTTKFAVASPPPTKEIEPTAPATPEVSETKTQAAVASRPASPKSQPETWNNPAPPPQVVRVDPEPAIVATPNASAPLAQPSGEVPSGTKSEKPSTWHRLNPANWFGSSEPKGNYTENGVTPLPPSASSDNHIKPTASPVQTAPVVEPKPIKIIPPAPPVFPRYEYLSPRKPKAGDHKAAVRAFADAQQFEQKLDWDGALDAYKRAAQLDPSWFEVQYNCGVLAYRQKHFDQSLSAWEMALAIQPASMDARYNFAMALKTAGYVTDAINELKKILSVKPGEARAHLALANIYAQQFRDPAQARPHYLKVLELDPSNPEAANIQFWLSANPP